MSSLLRRAALAVVLSLTPAFGHAAVLEFFGQDLGLGETQRLATTPATDRARDDFRSRLEGGRVESFETLAHGTYAWTRRDGTWHPGRRLGFERALDDRGTPLTGTLYAATGTVVEQPSGTNGFGRYPTQGDKFFHTKADPIIFEFATPIRAFGFDGIDVGDFNGQLTVAIFSDDSLLYDNTIGHARNGAGGDVLFWGIAARDNAFNRVVLGNTNGAADVFALDQITIAETLVTPLPAALPAFATALAGLAWLRRRRTA